MNNFRIHCLDPQQFAALFALDDSELAARHIQRRLISTRHEAPCRVSLADAEPGEEVLLLPFAHHSAATPYRSSGPIFVRRGAQAAQLSAGEVPESLQRRLLAFRAYDADGWMLGCEVAPGTELAAALQPLLALPGCAFVNLHYARAGCYAARVTRC